MALKIAIVGHYGGGKICDDLIGYTLARTLRIMFPGDKITVFDRSSISDIDQDFDLVLLGGGTLLGNNSIFLRPENPFSIFGAGVRIEKGWRKTAKLLLKKADTVVLRGQYSLKISKQIVSSEERLMGKMIGLGDPLLLLETSDKRGRRCLGSNLRAMPFGETSALPSVYYEEFIPDLVSKIAEDEDLEAEYLNFADQDYAPGVHKSIMISSPKEAIEQMNGYKYWIGQRLHSSGLALIKGIPTVFFNYQFNKAKDFCSTIDYDYVLDMTGELKQDRENFVQLFESLKGSWDFESIKAMVNKRRMLLKEYLRKIIEGARNEEQEN